MMDFLEAEAGNMIARNHLQSLPAKSQGYFLLNEYRFGKKTPEM